MQYIIAPDSFKGCLTSEQVADAILNGIRSVDTQGEITTIYIGDGGEGTIDALVKNNSAATASRHKVEVHPSLLHHPIITAEYITLQALSSWEPGREDRQRTLCLIELARANGLPQLLVSQRNCWLTSTYGTGELIRHCLLTQHQPDIVLFLGGSSTNDAGVGILSALGFRFVHRISTDNIENTDDPTKDYEQMIERIRNAIIQHIQPDNHEQEEAGKQLQQRFDDEIESYQHQLPSSSSSPSSYIDIPLLPIGAHLQFVNTILPPAPDMVKALEQSTITIACDVLNPMVGPHGCSTVYAPQKGASPEICEALESGVKHYIHIVQEYCGDVLHDICLESYPSLGAAGGCGGIAPLLLYPHPAQPPTHQSNPTPGHKEEVVATANPFVKPSRVQIQSGIDIVLDHSPFFQQLRNAGGRHTLVITGEGSIDRQTSYGKAIYGLSQAILSHRGKGSQGSESHRVSASNPPHTNNFNPNTGSYRPVSTPIPTTSLLCLAGTIPEDDRSDIAHALHCDPEEDLICVRSDGQSLKDAMQPDTASRNITHSVTNALKRRLNKQ